MDVVLGGRTVPAGRRRGAGTVGVRRSGTVAFVQLVTRTRREGPWSVSLVSGELDVVGGPDLHQHVMGLVRAGERHLLLDLGGVDFIDSFGLGVLIGALKRVRLLDGELRLVVAEPRLRRVFEVCDLDRVFTLHRSVDDALAVGSEAP